METYDPQDITTSLSLITHVQVETADKSDANALLPVFEKADEENMAPQELLADSLYGSDDNCEQAKTEYDVSVVSPVMGRTGNGLGLKDFLLDDEGYAITCPQSCSTARVKSKKRFSVAFFNSGCQSCPVREDCPVVPGKKAASLRYSAKDVRLADRRRHEKTESFLDKYRFRARSGGHHAGI